MLVSMLGLIARNGRVVLVAGLVAGLLMPQTAMALRPWLSEMVLALLFLTAFRVGLPAALSGAGQARETFAVVLAYQLALPLLCIGLFALFGLAGSPVAIALTLMCAAPPVTGSPSMSVMLGHSPDPAFGLLILGTLILPVTIIPVFWASPALGSLPVVIEAAMRLGLVIAAVVAAAFVCRAAVKPDMSARDLGAVDGVTSLALFLIVIGLMSAVAPALSSGPWALAGWLALAMAVNLGLQGLAFVCLRRFGTRDTAAPRALVAGNRNVALFLVASSATQSDAFLVFLGCYQFPMYLTPILMRPVLQRKPAA